MAGRGESVNETKPDWRKCLTGEMTLPTGRPRGVQPFYPQDAETKRLRNAARKRASRARKKAAGVPGYWK